MIGRGGYTCEFCEFIWLSGFDDLSEQDKKIYRLHMSKEHARSETTSGDGKENMLEDSVLGNRQEPIPEHQGDTQSSPHRFLGDPWHCSLDQAMSLR
jgi:hypothetical protein